MQIWGSVPSFVWLQKAVSILRMYKWVVILIQCLSILKLAKVNSKQKLSCKVQKDLFLYTNVYLYSKDTFEVSLENVSYFEVAFLPLKPIEFFHCVINHLYMFFFHLYLITVLWDNQSTSWFFYLYMENMYLYAIYVNRQTEAEKLNGFSHIKLFLLHCYTLQVLYNWIKKFFLAEKIILHILNITTKLSFNIYLYHSSKWDFF